MQQRKKRTADETHSEILNVSSVAAFLGVTDKAVYAKVARRCIPFRKWGGKLIFVKSEVEEFLARLQGVEVHDALENELKRRGLGEG
ncbi:MAG: helix-turn-helix domain-containing protein [Acidobacteria bacterium]|nr:helix-turn-helix domain-containing protein [Acidobacteriota bacterium]